MTSNIVLIGMPGAGKSTVGVVLAKRLGRGFIDGDLVIQERTGKRLPELIETHGHQGFLALEDEILAGLQVSGQVIATGGSAIYGERAMRQLQASGVVVYLRLPLDAITERVGELSDRGVAMAPGQSLADIYRDRVPRYERWADEVIDCDGLALREVVRLIDQRLAGSAVAQ